MRYRAREMFRLPRRGPHYYFRRYSAAINRDGARGGFTSHGFRVHVPVLGPVTINLTHRTYTWDNPGPGAVSGSWGSPRS